MKIKKIRVLVVDDENVVREGFVAILKLQPDLHVVGEAVDGLQAVEVARKTKPDVVLLDLQMPRQDGLTTIPKLQRLLPECKSLVLTSYDQNDRVYEAVKSGALGFLLKDATRLQVVQAIRDVANGVATIQPSIAVKLIKEIQYPAHGPYSPDALTARELQTLRLIALGKSNQEIGHDMGVHVRTVAKYVSGILDKLHLSSRTQAALYAIRTGLTEPRDRGLRQ
jgi:NarL family two-component system response regulator LiaR